MSNPSKQKGTSFESELVPLLRKVWPNIERAGTAKGPNDYGDYINVDGWLIEAKKHDKWRLPEWVRKIQGKVGPRVFPAPWALVVAADRRSLEGTFVVQPLDQWLAALEVLRETQDIMVRLLEENDG